MFWQASGIQGQGFEELSYFNLISPCGFEGFGASWLAVLGLWVWPFGAFLGRQGLRGARSSAPLVWWRLSRRGHARFPQRLRTISLGQEIAFHTCICKYKHTYE